MKYTFKNVMILGLGCLLGFTSCSDSWLNTDSTQTAGGDVIFSTTDNAKLVINGICRTMVQQHAYYGQNFNGEGTMKLLYGEYPGQDFNFPYMAPGWSPLMNNQSTITQSSSSIYDSYPWYYYYLIIGNANAVINRIDKAEGSQEEKDFLKAEALTFRAYSFFRLAELYCEPWARSNDGATDGVVLRIKEVAEAGEETDLKLSTLAETYKQVYDDLDEALRLYEVSGLTRDDIYWDATSNISFPDAPVAHAIYARAALTRQDYAVAKEHAALARANFPLMDTNTYYSGFCTPSSEWIWGVYNDASETICVKTPTAAAEFLIDCMNEAADELESLAARLCDGVRNLLVQEQQKLVSYRNRIPSAAYGCISDAKLTLLTVRKDIVQAVTASLFRQHHRLELLQQRLADASPEKQLARGYSITLKNGKAIKNASLLNEGDEIITRLYKGEVVSVVTNKLSKK